MFSPPSSKRVGKTTLGTRCFSCISYCLYSPNGVHLASVLCDFLGRHWAILLGRVCNPLENFWPNRIWSRVCVGSRLNRKQVAGGQKFFVWDGEGFIMKCTSPLRLLYSARNCWTFVVKLPRKFFSKSEILMLHHQDDRVWRSFVSMMGRLGGNEHICIEGLYDTCLERRRA
jgi:hypothetical protein